MKDIFDELDESVHIVGKLTNDIISSFSNEGLVKSQMEEYRKCKKICTIACILVVLVCAGILYFHFH